LNVGPKDGGSIFAVVFYTTGTNENFQKNNITKALEDRGLVGNTKVKKLYDGALSFGGPIKQDRLWFFLAYRHENNLNYAANLFQNANRNDRTNWNYVP